MTQTRTKFVSYWQSVDDEVMALSGDPVVIEESPIRTNEVSTAYSVRFRGIGGISLFAHYSVPLGEGPFPALLQAPGYGSVVGVPAHERRGRYAVMALSHRGQRLSDSEYAAAYPGLLTDGLPGPAEYRWRGIAADCLRALDVLADLPGADSARLAVAGNDLAAITAALRPRVRFLLLGGQMLFRDSIGRRGEQDAYPLEEFNDYLRSYPETEQEVADTLSLFDPIAFAPRIEAETLVTGSTAERPSAQQFVDALSVESALSVRSGRGYLDHKLEEDWLAKVTGAGEPNGATS
jgi:cephalosporin-C deacetylase